MATAAAYEAALSSSYRVKFRKDQFMELVRMAQPRHIYRVKNMHFFAYDGFVMYCQECMDHDFGQRVIEAIEFSNEPWRKS
uniref:Uncharacterized protein n=1 Tax=Candidatus Methanomethylicus mesodigestus TaxID=1867258 RepID=A0A7C3J472_9CREN